MSERETKKLTTPSGKPFEMKTFITARERNFLRDIFLEKISLDTSNPSAPAIKNLDGSMLAAAEKRVLEVAVLTFDGSSENIAERLLDCSPADYDFIVGEANKIANLGVPK